MLVLTKITHYDITNNTEKACGLKNSCSWTTLA